MNEKCTDEAMDLEDAVFTLFYNEAQKHFSANPIQGLIRSRSCGTCSFWDWGYEGEGDCKKYGSVAIIIDDEERTINRGLNAPGSTDICDDFQMKEKL